MLLIEQNQEKQLGNDLPGRVARWREETSDVTGDHVRTLLSNHGEYIKSLRNKYNTFWEKEVQERFDGSRTAKPVGVKPPTVSQAG